VLLVRVARYSRAPVGRLGSAKSSDLNFTNSRAVVDLHDVSFCCVFVYCYDLHSFAVAVCEANVDEVEAVFSVVHSVVSVCVSVARGDGGNIAETYPM